MTNNTINRLNIFIFIKLTIMIGEKNERKF